MKNMCFLHHFNFIFSLLTYLFFSLFYHIFIYGIFGMMVYFIATVRSFFLNIYIEMLQLKSVYLVIIIINHCQYIVLFICPGLSHVHTHISSFKKIIDYEKRTKTRMICLLVLLFVFVRLKIFKSYGKFTITSE